MRQYKVIVTALCTGVLALWGSCSYAEEFSARLNGFQELGALNAQTGAVLSNGTGTLQLDVDRNAQMIDYKLVYSDLGTTLPQTGTVSQAHIHFGKARDSGGVMVFFCTNLGNGPAGTPGCPANSTGPKGLTGTFSAASVVAIPGQNVKANDFNALVEAITSNTAYANIHTVPLSGATNTAFPAGEIRGQIHRADRDEKHDNHDNHDNHEHK
jgi:hypothetical protein